MGRVEIGGEDEVSQPDVKFGHHLESWCNGAGRDKDGPKAGDKIMVMVYEERGRGKNGRKKSAAKEEEEDEGAVTVLKLDLPGGKRELCEGSEDAARRECWEETGVVINKDIKGVGGKGREVAYWNWFVN